MIQACDYTMAYLSTGGRSFGGKPVGWLRETFRDASAYEYYLFSCLSSQAVTM